MKEDRKMQQCDMTSNSTTGLGEFTQFCFDVRRLSEIFLSHCVSERCLELLPLLNSGLGSIRTTSHSICINLICVLHRFDFVFLHYNLSFVYKCWSTHPDYNILNVPLAGSEETSSTQPHLQSPRMPQPPSNFVPIAGVSAPPTQALAGVHCPGCNY